MALLLKYEYRMHRKGDVGGVFFKMGKYFPRNVISVSPLEYGPLVSKYFFLESINRLLKMP